MEGRCVVSLWQQIRETLAQEIADDVVSPGDRLPAAADLAARFGVNRHTVLKAIAHLQTEGLLRTERGGGIYVESAIPYRLGPRDRLEENLLELNRVPSRELISVIDMSAPKPVADALALSLGAPIVLVTLVGAADGMPISYNRNYFPVERLPGVGDLIRDASGSDVNLATRALLQRLGVRDFRRKTVRIRTRRARPDELRHLRMPATENVFEVDVTNVDGKDVPIAFGSTAFCGSRVEFVLDL